MQCPKKFLRFCSISFLPNNNNSYLYRKYCVTQTAEPQLCVYNLENERILMKYFELNTKSYDTLIKSNKFLAYICPDHIKNSLKTCSNFNLNRDVLVEHVWVLQADHAHLETKLNILSKMNFSDINHGIPFMNHSPGRLMKLKTSIKNEEKQIPLKNRLYYLSKKLETDPQFLAKYIARRLFVYSTIFTHLQKTLDVVLGMGVKPENVINDLWVLTYNYETVQKRLEEFRDAGNEKLMPWMVRCAETNRERSIQHTAKTIELLVNNNNTHNYLAGRLDCNEETVSQMAKKIPSIVKVNVCKVSDILDFLFAEGYTKEEIISVPRVLAHSLNTLQARQKILKSFDADHKNLNYLCKSKANFNNFVFKLEKFHK